METIQKAVMVLHTLIALMIIVLVLLQRGKGADAGAGFGAGASGTVFGARGSSSFFTRATAICAALFFASSLALAYLSSQSTSSPTSLLESAQPAETGVDEPVIPEESAPVIEPAAEEAGAVDAEEALDIPELEEPAGDQE